MGWEFWIPNCLIVVGFIVTIVMNNKNASDLVKNFKKTNTTTMLEGVPLLLCELIDAQHEQNAAEKTKNTRKFKEMLGKLISYGGKDANKIAVKMQIKTYENANFSNEILSLYCLLLTQLKYDLTTDIISPATYPSMRLINYDEIKEGFIKYTNSFVDELNLNKKFKV